MQIVRICCQQTKLKEILKNVLQAERKSYQVKIGTCRKERRALDMLNIKLLSFIICGKMADFDVTHICVQQLWTNHCSQRAEIVGLNTKATVIFYHGEDMDFNRQKAKGRKLPTQPVWLALAHLLSLQSRWVSSTALESSRASDSSLGIPQDSEPTNVLKGRCVVILRQALFWWWVFLSWVQQVFRGLHSGFRRFRPCFELLPQSPSLTSENVQLCV